MNSLLWLGGLANREHILNTTINGFNGLITHLVVNGYKINILINTVVRKNITSLNSCEIENKCSSGEQCVSSQNRNGYTYFCFNQMKNDSQCQAIPDCKGKYLVGI